MAIGVATTQAVPHPPAGLRWRLLQAGGVHSLTTGLSVSAVGLIIVGSLATGAGADLLPGLLCLILCLAFLHIFVTSHRFPSYDERAWFLGLIRVAFLLRVVLAVVIYYGPLDHYAFGEDQRGYDNYPRVIAAYWSGEIESPVLLSTSTVQSRIGYYNFVTLQYYLISPSFLLPRIVNCLGGALLVFYTYKLATLVFGRAEGRLTAAWTAIFPSLVLWSSVNLRDVWLALSVCAIVYHTIRLRQQFTVGAPLIIAAHLIWIQYNRSYLVLIMAAGIAAIFVLARSRNLGRDVVVGGLLVGLLFALHRGLGLGHEGLEWLDLEKIAELRGKLARADVGRSGYLGDIDIENPGVLASFFPLLLAYFLFSPFPWEMTGFRRLITLPEMVFWYWLIPFVWIAIRNVFRERDNRRMMLLLPTCVITVAFALPSANIGLAYRYRAQVIGLILPFAAAGYIRRRYPALAGQDETRASGKPSP